MESFPTTSKLVRGLQIFTNKIYLKIFFVTVLFNSILFLSTAAAQESGSVYGKVIDAKTNEELIGANIFLDGTTIGAATDIEGNYYIKNIPAGEYTLVASMIGYSKLTVTKLMIKPGDHKKLDISLTSEALQTEEVVVTAEALKNTETSVLKIQQNSASIVDGVSSELISKNSSSDGTDVLKRMSGITISEGKYAFVRGVGDRYNSTLLNGASLPSTDPEKKSFSYDIIPAGLIENVITAKTFTPDKPADFSGGLVQITTVDFPSSFMLNVSASTGYNSNTTLKNFDSYNGGKTDFLGIDDGTRSKPGTISDTRVVRGNYTDAQLLDIARSFKNNWQTTNFSAPANGGMKITIGDKYDLGENSLFGYIGSFDYSNSSTTSYRQKNFYDFSGARYLYNGTSYTNSVMMSGMLNLSTKFNGNNKISLKNLINQNSDNETTGYLGDYRYANQYKDITSLRFVSRTLQSHQLAGEHFFNLLNGITWNWDLSYSRSDRNEPDARRYVYARDIDNPNEALRLKIDPSITTRFYSELQDKDYGFTTNFQIKPFVDPLLPHFSFGVLYNKKERNFDARIFGFRNNVGGSIVVEDSVLQLSIDKIFQPENINPTFITINEITKPSDSYSSLQRVGAGYVMLDATILRSFRLVTGVRYEYSEQNMDSYTITDDQVAVRDIYRDWLPSINLTYLLNEDINVRFAYSKTLARPEFREIAPFQYFDFLANELVEGNPDLKRALINNYDLRFEVFPGAGELFALSLFYKRFINPIELILIASSSNEPIRSYANAISADNYGAEIEIRKSLSFINDYFNNFSVVSNLSLIHSKIKIDNSGSQSFQESNRPLQGQADYIINFGLYYDNFEAGLNTGIVYNRVGNRISKVGYADLGDIVEKPVDEIDLIVSKKLFDNFVIKASAMDILNQTKKFIQRTPIGDKIAESYNNGRTIKLSISYQL